MVKGLCDKSFAEVLFVDNELEAFNEAIKWLKSAEWKTAMDNKIRSMHKHDGWELTELSPGKKTINKKWVYCNPDESVDKYHARLVINGCAQRLGVDYAEVLSPVACLEIFRSLLSIAAVEKMILQQFGILNVFLYGTNHVCHLKVACTTSNRHHAAEINSLITEF